MKNFNIMGVHSKIWFLGGREVTKIKYIGDCLKRGTWTVWRFKRGLGEKERGGTFDGGLIHQFTLCKLGKQKCFCKPNKGKFY